MTKLRANSFGFYALNGNSVIDFKEPFLRSLHLSANICRSIAFHVPIYGIDPLLFINIHKASLRMF